MTETANDDLQIVHDIPDGLSVQPDVSSIASLFADELKELTACFLEPQNAQR